MEFEELGVVKYLRKTNLSSNLWWLRENILRTIREREATAEKFNLSNYEKALTEVNNKLFEKDEAFKHWCNLQPKKVDLETLASVFYAFDDEDKVLNQVGIIKEVQGEV